MIKHENKDVSISFDYNKRDDGNDNPEYTMVFCSNGLDDAEITISDCKSINFNEVTLPVALITEIANFLFECPIIPDDLFPDGSLYKGTAKTTDNLGQKNNIAAPCNMAAPRNIAAPIIEKKNNNNNDNVPFEVPFESFTDHALDPIEKETKIAEAEVEQQTEQQTEEEALDQEERTRILEERKDAVKKSKTSTVKRKVKDSIEE